MFQYTHAHTNTHTSTLDNNLENTQVHFFFLLFFASVNSNSFEIKLNVREVIKGLHFVTESSSLG